MERLNCLANEICIAWYLVPCNLYYSSNSLFRECFQRAEALRLKQEDLLEKRGKGESKQRESTLRDGRTRQSVKGVALEDSGDDSDDVDLDNLEMDWRAKHS